MCRCVFGFVSVSFIVLLSLCEFHLFLSLVVCRCVCRCICDCVFRFV